MWCSIISEKEGEKIVLKYELKKIFSKRMNRILLTAAFLLAIVFSIFAIGSNQYLDKNGVLHKGPGAARTLVAEKNKWAGALTPEVLSQVTAEKHRIAGQYPQGTPEAVYAETGQTYMDIEFMINDIIRWKEEYDPNAILTITPEGAKDLYQVRENNIAQMIREYGDTPEKREFLHSQFQKAKPPFHYEAAESWDTMQLQGTTYGLVLVILIGALGAGIFADEFKLGADGIFFSSRYGKTKAVRTKIWAGLMMATAVYWGGMVILSVISFGVMGISGGSTPVQVGQSYSIYAVTYMEQYLLILLGGYVAGLISATTSMLIAAKTHSTSLAVAVPFVLFCVSPFIGRALPFDTLFKLTPDQLMNIMNCIKLPLIYQVGETVFRQIPFILVFYGVISLALLPFVYTIIAM